jgi:hypothetical protein
MIELSEVAHDDTHHRLKMSVAEATQLDNLEQLVEETVQENRRLHAEMRILWDILVYDGSEMTDDL